MVNYYFLILLLFIVFTNLYFKYKLSGEEYFSNKKRRKRKRKKKKKKEAQRKLEELNNLIKNTNNYFRDNVIFDKLQYLDVSQLREYLSFLVKQDPKYEKLTNYYLLKKKISNNEYYIQNQISIPIKSELEKKYL